MAFAIIFFSGLLCKNIYFGPGQPFATFEDAFQVAEIGDNLIEARIDSIKLETGINWKCLPVLDDVLTGNNLASHIFNEIQQPPYPAALEEIEFQDGVDIYYDGNNWQNNTRQFTSDLGFKIHMNEAYTLEITGFLEAPYHVIELGTGDNWIGYYLEGSMYPLDAFDAV